MNTIGKVEKNSKSEKLAIPINQAKILLKSNISDEDRKRLKFSISWLENENSSANEIVAATALIKILEEKYDLYQTKKNK